MQFFFHQKRLLNSISKVSVGSVFVSAMAVVSGSNAEASSCYHHYWGASWEGQGMAIVFCKNSGDSELLASCGVWNEDTHEKVTPFQEHLNGDHGRQVFADYDTPGSTFGNDSLVVICKGNNGKTYSYPVGSANGLSRPGICEPDTNYYGPASECSGDSDHLLTLTKRGRGTVVGNKVGLYGGGIECGPTCVNEEQMFFNYLEQDVTLTATAAEGYKFVRWEGDCEGADKCVVKMTEARDVTAVFDKSAPTPSVNHLLLRTKQ